MTIDALRHLAELLNDAGGYAAANRRRNRPRTRRTTPEVVPA